MTKAIDMTLLDWFATFAPEPSIDEVDTEKRQDRNKAHHNDKYIMRGDMEIRCNLRYRWAVVMMRARV